MTEPMRIAAGYFERLIDHTPASDAVSDIAAMSMSISSTIFGATDTTFSARSAASPIDASSRPDPSRGRRLHPTGATSDRRSASTADSGMSLFLHSEPLGK
jgi:hypothetical protein